jgi:hypothetical protein
MNPMTIAVGSLLRGAISKRFAKVSLSAIAVAVALLALTQADAAAGTASYTFTVSGTAAQVPIDLDGNGSSCTTVPAAVPFTLCPADSAMTTSGGNTVGKKPNESGPWTAQAVTEIVAAPGTGCSYSGSIQGCPIDSVSNGCLFNYVGGNSVTRFTETGDLNFHSITSGTLCINVSGALPWDFEGQLQATTTGGTGALSGASGSFSETFRGQVLQNDPAGHGMSWTTGSGTGTLTVP